MAMNYVYRVHHDVGFAPHIHGTSMCTLSGCKNKKKKDRPRNVEELASKGSWVIGIGGNKTGRANKLIYAMKVEENLLFSDFRKKYPNQSKYYNPKDPDCAPGSNVLVSHEFSYFGDKAIDIPKELKRIIIRSQGFKYVSDKDVSLLKKKISKYGRGKLGNPISPQSTGYKKKSICRRTGCKKTSIR